VPDEVERLRAVLRETARVILDELGPGDQEGDFLVTVDGGVSHVRGDDADGLGIYLTVYNGNHGMAELVFVEWEQLDLLIEKLRRIRRPCGVGRTPGSTTEEARMGETEKDTGTDQGNAGNADVEVNVTHAPDGTSTSGDKPDGDDGGSDK
jgi:hypothetical protein